MLRTIKGDPAIRNIPVVFHAIPNNDLIKQALELGAEDWYPKPYNVEITAMKLARIVSRVHANPASTDGVHGNLGDMGIIEMVQILSFGGRSVQIVLENENHIAELAIQKGQIVSATEGDLQGEAAVLRILGWRDGQFRIMPLKQTPATTVHSSTDTLLLHSCLLQDHAKQNPLPAAAPTPSRMITP